LNRAPCFSLQGRSEPIGTSQPGGFPRRCHYMRTKPRSQVKIRSLRERCTSNAPSQRLQPAQCRVPLLRPCAECGIRGRGTPSRSVSPVARDALPGRRDGIAAAVWWAAAFCYVLATVTRLSFYNVEQDESRFVGVPTPAIALIWSTCLLWPVAWWAVPFVSSACAVVMVAPVIIPRPRGAVLACFALWGVSLVALHAVRLFR
jgi:hypothetical protein